MRANHSNFMTWCVLALGIMEFADNVNAFATQIATPSLSRGPTTKIPLFGSFHSNLDRSISANSYYSPLFRTSTSPQTAPLGDFKFVLRNRQKFPFRFQCWNPIKSMVRTLSRQIHRSAMIFLFFATVFLAVLPPATAAGSSGRMGGSFGSSGSRNGGHSSTRVHSSSYGRTSRSQYYNSSPWSRSSGRPFRIVPMRYGYHHRHHYQFGPSTSQDTMTTITNPDGTTTIVRRESHTPHKLRFSLSDVILVTGAAAWVAYGISKNYQDREDGSVGPDSPLGPGFSILSLTACLNVPDRNDPNSILQRLSQLAQTSDTSHRKGLQDLIAETSLELARQEKAIISVESHYDHKKTPTQAERQYNRLSAQQRSKFDRESLSNYGGKRSHVGKQEGSSSSAPSSATIALVNIHLAIEGNSLRDFDSIRTRKNLKEALSRISSDVQIEDCLLAAEVIWSPEDPTEQLLMEDIYSDFPTLYTLLE